VIAAIPLPTLAGLGKFDDSLGDHFADEMIPLSKPKGYARAISNATPMARFALRVECDVAIEEWCDGHDSSMRR
jgi:hypothetical protein